MDVLAELLGESPAMEALREQLRRLATWRDAGRRLPAVLLHGETGTGKGLLARLIHQTGPRRLGPFVDVNCAAIPEPLLEAELFGFERGAFTDARRAKPGLFQTAHRGVLFLDEVALLPEPLQAKLLKVLEDQSVRRLGATHPEPADVWVISATNADLAAAIRARHFRDDLYHRLAVLSLTLPPLRARGRDVLLLADRILERVCRDYGMPHKRLADDARARLLAHPWPGNIRELSNVLERAALVTEEPVLTEALLAFPRPAHPQAPPPPEPPAPPAVSMDEAAADHIRATLAQTGGNISRTAVRLGISRNTLRARMDRLGLAPGRPGRRPGGGVSAGGRTLPVPPPPAAVPPAAAPAPPPAPASVLRWQRHHVTMLRVTVVPPDGDTHTDTARALPLLLDKVRTFGGRIEEVGRAGFDASYGVETMEAAPQLAAHAALAVLKAAERARRLGDEDLGVKVALHTEPCLVGVTGTTLQIDQQGKRRMAAVLDDLTARARAHSAVVSPAASAFLERRFALSPAGVGAGAQQLDGHGAAGLGLWGRPGPFVGRHDELRVLRSRVALAREGRGQLVGLVGAAGVGKSRLVRELVQGLAGSVLALETAAVALGTPTPLYPIAELVRRYFRLDPADPAPAVAAKVAERLGELDPRLRPAGPAIAGLLGGGADDPDWAALAPGERRRRTFDAIKQVLIAESARQPLCLVVEDAHWIDTESQAFLDALVDALPGAPILLLFTYRPEYQHPWAGRTVYSQLRVDPLPRAHADQLLQALLGQDPSLDTLPARLAEWTEGNPFFLEESVRSLVELGALAGELGDYRLVRPVTAIQVPPTVEEVLAARIDRLPPAPRRLLQSAAVIGHDVPIPILAGIAGLPEPAFSEALRQLKAAELLLERVGAPDGECVFAHALTHEVTYASVAQGRRELHAQVLETMEPLYADRLGEHADRLAHHALRGQVWDKALRYLQAAGRRAFARSANHQAAAFVEQALSVVERLPDGPDTRELAIDLRLDLRHALTMLGDAPRTVERLREAEALAERLGDRQRLGRVLSFQANGLFLLAEYGRAIAVGGRALALAESLGDFGLRIATVMYLGRAHHGLGEYPKALALFGEIVTALGAEREHEHLGLPVLPAVFARSHLAWCLAELGRFDEAERHAAEATRLAVERGHPDTLLWAHRATGWCHLARGAGAAAASVLDRALDLARSSDLPVYVPPVSAELASAWALDGRAEEAMAPLRQAVDGATARHQRMILPQIVLRLADAALGAGRLEEAAEAGRRARALLAARGERGHEAHVLRVLGEVALTRDPADPAAEQHLEGALALAESLGMRPLAARCRLGLGLLWRRRGDEARAAARLREALEPLRQMGMVSWARAAETALGA